MSFKNKGLFKVKKPKEVLGFWFLLREKGASSNLVKVVELIETKILFLLSPLLAFHFLIRFSLKDKDEK